MKRCPPRTTFSRLIVIAVLLALVTMVVQTANPAVSRGAGGLEEIGRLAVPQQETWPGFNLGYLGIARERQRLYTYSRPENPQGGRSTQIAEFDLSSRVPKVVRVSDFGVTTAAGASPYLSALDPERSRILIIAKDSVAGASAIDVIDLDSLTSESTWPLAAAVPGFTPFGMTLDDKTNRLYLVGEMSGSNSTTTTASNIFGRPATPGPTIVALDGDDGTGIWAAPLPGCGQVLYNASSGALVAKSPHRPVLYVFCDGGAFGLGQPTPTGQSGLIRLHIADDATADDAVNFEAEFFPVSGAYQGGTADVRGVAAFHPGTERMFVQSMSPGTPGAWVFDGLRSAWVGFVAADDNSNQYIGVNQATGRYYMGSRPSDGSPGWINVTDGTATPIPQGRAFSGWPADMMLPDPDSNRLFTVWRTAEDDNLAHFTVMEDDTPAILPRQDVDYDALTNDLPDDLALMNYSGGIEGFGARHVVVGGVEGPLTGISAAPPTAQAGLSYGDRGAEFALVPGVDLTRSGASASAAIGASDNSTKSDTADAERDTGSTCGEDEGDDEPCVPAGTLSFPFGLPNCLDGAGERMEVSEQGVGETGEARVVCDLAGGLAEGDAEYEGGSGRGGFSIDSARISTRTTRDAERGVVTETMAQADGVLISVAGQPLFSIDRVTVTATTVANGRPGSASAEWVRVVEGASVLSPDGATSSPQSCTTTVVAGEDVQRSGDCDVLEEQINGALGTRMTVRFPLPEVVATDRGAFSSVQEAETDYLNGLTVNNDDRRSVPGVEILMTNDTNEKSRGLIQLAGVRANSIFTRSAKFVAPPPRTPAPTETEPEPESTNGPSEVVVTRRARPTVTPTQPPVALVRHEERLVGAFGWLPLARSLGQGLLVGGLYLLLALPLLQGQQRRRLLAAHQDPRKFEDLSPQAGNGS